MFIIEDEMHAEFIGEFKTKDDAITELKRISQIPWNIAPNRAPCTSWENCARNYVIIEYDDSKTPWKTLSETYLLWIDAQGPKWKDTQFNTITDL